MSLYRVHDLIIYDRYAFYSTLMLFIIMVLMNYNARMPSLVFNCNMTALAVVRSVCMPACFCFSLQLLDACRQSR